MKSPMRLWCRPILLTLTACLAVAALGCAPPSTNPGTPGGAISASPAGSGVPRIELAAARIDFGSIAQTSEMTTITQISNRGTAPLKLLNLVGT